MIRQTPIKGLEPPYPQQNTPEEALDFRNAHSRADLSEVWAAHEARNAITRARLSGLRLRRWPTDYGRGPKRWVITLRQSAWRSVNLAEAMRHPIRAYRWLVHGEPR